MSQQNVEIARRSWAPDLKAYWQEPRSIGGRLTTNKREEDSLMPEPHIAGKGGQEREADESEPPVIEPDPAPEPKPSEPGPDEDRDREDKPGVDEYDDERLPPEPTDPSEGG